VIESSRRVRKILRTHRADVIGHEQHPPLATSLCESFRPQNQPKFLENFFAPGVPSLAPRNQGNVDPYPAVDGTRDRGVSEG
jgi:hypothetical protein